MRLKEFKRNLKNEYKNTFKDSKKNYFSAFKLKYAMLSLALIFVAFLLIEHVHVYVYNSTINEKTEERINNKSLNRVDSQNEYKSLIKSYSLATKQSVLSKILNFQLIGCSAGMDGGANSAPNQIESSFQTNVQVEGIDEADVSKCDGRYIYALVDDILYIYDLNGVSIISQTENAENLYIKDNLVITLGCYQSNIYEFDGTGLNKVYELEYNFYIDSRLKNNHLYFVVASRANESNIDYGNCYFDGLCAPSYVYSIVDVDLEKMEETKIQALSGYGAIMYASQSNFYLVSYCRLNNEHITSIIMFDENLEAVGMMKLKGTINDQFSLDEYNGYLRVVATDTMKDAERLNSISIFDIKTLKLVGYLDEGIGIGRQIVKSVTYSQDICYVVTYENTDPLYKIDCSNPSNPQIVSKYQAPGYSNYMYTFNIGDKEYILGLGYTDSLVNTKISLYVNGESGAVQVGNDFIIGQNDYYDHVSYMVESELNYEMFTNHKALFIYNDESYLYFGTVVGHQEYLIFKVDVNNVDNPVSIDKKVNINNLSARCYLINGKTYIVDVDKLIINEWN